MHEVFLTAIVPDADIERAKALLQGLSGMTAHAGLHRVLYFAGPSQPRGVSIRGSIPTPLQPNQVRQWSELHQQLSRQSFVMQARYALQHSDFGQATLEGIDAAATLTAALSRLNSTPALLRWTDIPVPTGGSNPLVVQRKKIDIPETRNVPTILQDNNHKFKSELIEESFAFFTNNTEYALVRYHTLPVNVVLGNGAPNNAAIFPLPLLPPWEEVVHPKNIAPVDPSGQWFLFVRRHVLDDTSPEKMAKAVEELEVVRKQLSGAFAFRPVDRRAHDTRIERPINNAPIPLPQKVRA